MWKNDQKSVLVDERTESPRNVGVRKSGMNPKINTTAKRFVSSDHMTVQFEISSSHFAARHESGSEREREPNFFLRESMEAESE